MLALSAPISAAEWTYQVRPGDTLWELAVRVLDSPDDWARVQEHNRIADPGQLTPGSQLRIPVSWLRIRPAPARVVASHGEVQLIDVGQTQGRAVSEGDVLVSGSRIETAAAAAVTIEFADGSRLLVQGNSTLQMDTLSAYGETGMVDTRMRLQRGRIESRVRPNRGPAGNFIIDTPPATTTVRGTEFRVYTSDTEQRSITEVVSGEVEVTSRDGTVRLRPLQASVLSDDDTAPRAVDLLPSPDLRGVRSRNLKPGDAITWQAVPGATGYRYRFQHLASERVVADAVIDQAHTSVPLLDNGDYRLQVRAIDDHGVEGQDAGIEVVVLGTPEPPFAVQPEPAAVMPPGSSVVFRWTEPADAISYRLQVASDADFTTLVAEHTDLRRARLTLRDALPPGRYHWRLASVDRDGRVGPFSDAEAFQIRERSAAPDADSIGRQRSTIRWRGGGEGQRYQVQVARDAEFRQIAIDEVVDQPWIEADRVGRGRWYLRVRLIDADGYEGHFSESQAIRFGCMPCRIGIGAAAALLLLL